MSYTSGVVCCSFVWYALFKYDANNKQMLFLFWGIQLRFIPRDATMFEGRSTFLTNQPDKPAAAVSKAKTLLS